MFPQLVFLAEQNISLLGSRLAAIDGDGGYTHVNCITAV